MPDGQCHLLFGAYASETVISREAPRCCRHGTALHADVGKSAQVSSDALAGREAPERDGIAAACCGDDLVVRRQHRHWLPQVAGGQRANHLAAGLMPATNEFIAADRYQGLAVALRQRDSANGPLPDREREITLGPCPRPGCGWCYCVPQRRAACRRRRAARASSCRRGEQRHDSPARLRGEVP